MGYKRHEIKIMKDGYYDLAKEVIRQWNQDGKPRGDLPGIQMWKEVLQVHQSMMVNCKLGVKQGSIKGVTLNEG